MTTEPPRRCGACQHFENGGKNLEEAFPGLVAMGSGFSSVRGGDGLCAVHELYLSYRAGCNRFEARLSSSL
jgi:hypothetical protein